MAKLAPEKFEAHSKSGDPTQAGLDRKNDEAATDAASMIECINGSCRVSYCCGAPSTAKVLNFAYFSPTFMDSL